jgi:muconolactone delta-isomerase
VGVWSAADASELDRLLAGLPAFGHMTIRVEALAQHYLEAGE